MSSDNEFHIPRCRQVVMTIHGINCNGAAWQDAAHSVLSPHFKPVKITYSQYKSNGGLTLALAPITLLLFSIVCLADLFLLKLSLLPRIVVWVSLIAATIFFALDRRRRTKDAISDVWKQMCEHEMFVHPPHIIAHSFGTLLVGCLLEKYCFFNCIRIVLVGGVLWRSFRWKKFVLGSPQVTSVRNEHGCCDWVVRFAPFVGLGRSGLHGFPEEDRVSHRVVHPEQPCERCKRTKKGVPVHSAPLDKYAHSDYLTPKHMEALWLSFLFGYDYTTYRDFKKLCSDIMDALDIGVYREALFGQLRKWKFVTFDGTRTPLEKHIRDNWVIFVEDKYGDANLFRSEVEERSDLTLLFLCGSVAEAIEAEKLPDAAKTHESQLQALNPQIAFERAFRKVKLERP